jgi:hypothetical protein
MGPTWRFLLCSSLILTVSPGESEERKKRFRWDELDSRGLESFLTNRGLTSPLCQFCVRRKRKEEKQREQMELIELFQLLENSGNWGNRCNSEHLSKTADLIF